MKQAYTCQYCFEPCYTYNRFTECSHCGISSHANCSCDENLFGDLKSISCEMFNEICKARSIEDQCDEYKSQLLYAENGIQYPADHDHSLCRDCISTYPTADEKYEVEKLAKKQKEIDLADFFNVTYGAKCRELEKSAMLILSKAQKISSHHPQGVEMEYRKSDYNRETIHHLIEQHPLLSQNLIKLKLID